MEAQVLYVRYFIVVLTEEYSKEEFERIKSK